MAKTRLRSDDRLAIVRAIIDHKFKPLLAVQDANEGVLAEEACRRAYGDFLQVMALAPRGAFIEDTDVVVAVNGMRVRLYFGPSAPDHSRPRRRVFADHQHSPILSLTDADEFGARVAAHARAGETLKQQRADLTSATAGALGSFNTFNDLRDAWPEAAIFINERWVKRGDFVSSVPAVVLSDLSSKLDLPPELAEAA